MDRTGVVMDRIDRFLERLTDDRRNSRAVRRGVMDRIDGLLLDLITEQDDVTHYNEATDNVTGNEFREVLSKMRQAQRRRDAIRAQIADEYRDLFTALESVEWVTNDAGLELCPCCDGMRDQGHGEFCEVGNALARARGES